MENLSLLAAGGITAAIVAGWSQVKGMFSYLSSFIIVRASFDDTSTGPLRSHLRLNWQLLPSGMLVFKSRYHQLRGRDRTNIVPFLLPASTAVYRKGRQLLFVSEANSCITVSYLRGTVDTKELLSLAIDAFEERCFGNGARISRFNVVHITGSEKGSWARSNGSVDDERPISASTGIDSSSSLAASVHLDLAMDTSFKYDSSLWSFTEEQDPFEALYYPEEILRYIEQAQQWLDLGEWYAKRLIPWRRGWLLHGPGGTGKSSLAKAVAQKLGIPIYQYFLSTLSDQEFIRRWEGMSVPCMVLLEDFDSVFDKRESLTEHKSLTFDCVLNMISGVSSGGGIFLVVTTNHLDKIDPALGVTWGEEGVSTRPGRIDTVIQVGYMSEANRRRLAERILQDWPEEIEPLVRRAGDKTTPVQFQEMALQIAFERLNQSTSSVISLNAA